MSSNAHPTADDDPWQMCDQHGDTLRALSETPALVVFLRHSGCLFCREMLAEIASERQAIESRGMRIVLVHMEPEAAAERLMAGYGLGDVSRISDPAQRLYQEFDLPNGTMGQLLGPSNWLRGARALFLRGHRVGLPSANPRRMPGAFVVHRGEIVRAHRHRFSGDQPDYGALCQISPGEPGQGG